MTAKIFSLTIPLLICLLFFSCKKDDPEPSLPPATLTGERTFGALVNGEVWIPKGRPDFFTPPLTVLYDPGYEGGLLDIRAYRILNKDSNTEQYMQIGMGNVDREGFYSFNSQDATLRFRSRNCTLKDGETDVFYDGSLHINRLDMEAGIISGTFNFTLAKPGCDTIRVTEGRFDYRL
jgi:hypothetical protein